MLHLQINISIKSLSQKTKYILPNVCSNGKINQVYFAIMSGEIKDAFTYLIAARILIW